MTTLSVPANDLSLTVEELPRGYVTSVSEVHTRVTPSGATRVTPSGATRVTTSQVVIYPILLNVIQDDLTLTVEEKK